MGHGDAAVDAASAAAAVLNRGDDAVSLGVQERAPGGDGGGRRGRGRRRLVNDHGGEQAEAVELAEGAADPAQSCVIDATHVADLDEAHVDLLLGDLGDEEGSAGGDGQLRQGGRRVVLEESLHVGLVPGLDVGLREGGLLEVLEDGGQAQGEGDVGDWGGGGEGGLESLEVGASLAPSGGGRQDGQVEGLGSCQRGVILGIVLGVSGGIGGHRGGGIGHRASDIRNREPTLSSSTVCAMPALSLPLSSPPFLSRAPAVKARLGGELGEIWSTSVSRRTRATVAISRDLQRCARH